MIPPAQTATDLAPRHERNEFEPPVDPKAPIQKRIQIPPSKPVYRPTFLPGHLKIWMVAPGIEPNFHNKSKRTIKSHENIELQNLDILFFRSQ